MCFKKTELLLSFGLFILCASPQKPAAVLPSFAAYDNGVMDIGTKDIVIEFPFVNPYLQISKSVIIPETKGFLVVDYQKPLTKLDVR